MNAELLLEIKNNTRDDMTKTVLSSSNSVSTNIKPDELYNHFFENGKDICIITHEMAANNSDFHGHNFFELNYVFYGTCFQNLDNKEKLTLNRGNVCILNPNASHSCHIESERDIVINILIKPTLFNSAFLSFISNNETLGTFFMSYLLSTPLKKNYLLFKNDYSDKTSQLFECIMKEYLSENRYANTNIKCYLILLLSHLMSNQVETITENQNSRIIEIMDYAASHLENISLQSVADHFYLHPNYISSYIKKHTGRTFAEIINEMRLVQAKYYLSNTTMSLQEISLMLGYSEHMSFHNMFKKNIGMTPLEFRNIFKN